LSYEKRIYRAAVSQSLRKPDVVDVELKVARKVLKWRGIREGCLTSWVVQYQHSSNILKRIHFLSLLFKRYILRTDPVSRVP